MLGCSIRAIWILNNQDTVVFSRRFPVVERRWQSACAKEGNEVSSLLPNDTELASAFVDRKKSEGSSRGFGIRVSQSAVGSDSWVDDPITRHIISLHFNKEKGQEVLLWPLVLHVKNYFCILVLPLVQPQHLKSYEQMCGRFDCGSSTGVEENLSSLLLELPCITGTFMVAHTIGDVITGELVEPEVVASSSPSVGGLLDSLTGSIGIPSISVRAKPGAASVSAPTASGISISGTITSDPPKNSTKLSDKDALQTFLTSSMPFGTPLDLSFINISTIKVNGFSSSDIPSSDLKQPAWKPYLYKGKQRILFTIHETIRAAMYDRDEISDVMSISGQVNCRAELEGLPDISFPMTGLNTALLEVLSFHNCAQVSEQGVDKQAMMFSPPLGNFSLMFYQASCGLGPPIQGFYQLSMVSEDEGAFLFKLRLMEGYKSPLSMEFCTLTMPFPTRKVLSFDGNASIGTVSSAEHSLEWKIITNGRGVTGKSIEATFPGTIRFAPLSHERLPSMPMSVNGSLFEEDKDMDTGIYKTVVNIEEYLMEKMNKGLSSVDLEEPFSWQAYNYAKLSFKIVGGTLSGMLIDPKSVTIYPSVKAPVEISCQVTSGEYILWNTLGKCPFVVSPKD